MNSLILLLGLFGQGDLFLPDPLIEKQVAQKHTRVYEQTVEKTVDKPLDAVFKIVIAGKFAGTCVSIGHGQLLTAAHVIDKLKPDDSLEFSVEGKLYSCWILKKDIAIDYAILGTDVDLLGCKIGIDDDVKIGIDCIGANTEGDRITVTKHTLAETTLKEFRIIDGKVNPGRSGGGIFTDDKLVGILVASATDWKSAYFVPISRIDFSTVQYELTFYSSKTCRFCKQQHGITDTANDRRIKSIWSEDPIPETIRTRLSSGYQFPVAVGTNIKGGYSWPGQSGVKTIDELVAFCEAANVTPVADLAFGAPNGPAIGAFAIGDQVAMMFANWNRYIGKHEASFTWNRSGLQTFPMYPQTAKLNFNDIFGKTGKIIIDCNSEALPVNHLDFGYFVGEDDEITFDIEKLKVKGLIAIFDEKVGNKQQAMGFIDPLTIYSIFSTIRTIWQMLHPTADLFIGSEIGAVGQMSDDMLDIKFNPQPQIRITWLFSFKLGIREVQIYHNKLIIFFSGSRWITQKTFDVE